LRSGNPRSYLSLLYMDMQIPTLLFFLTFSSRTISHPRKAQVALQPTLSSKKSSAIPGDSPCHHIGDPSNDLLSITSLDLEPNPPTEYVSTSRKLLLPWIYTHNLPHNSFLTVRLKGNLTSDIGPKPLLGLTAALNGTIGPGYTSDLCSSKLDITQNGTMSCPPRKGPVEMTYDIIIAYWWLKKGNYTVRVRMNATDGTRMTDFEGTVWVNGEVDDGDGGGWK